MVTSPAGATMSPFGGWFGELTNRPAVALAVAPSLSVTITLTVCEPPENVCVALEPGCGPTIVPSPKSNRYETRLPSASDEADAFAVTASGAGPPEGLSESAAVGGWFGAPTLTTSGADGSEAAPRLSVTVTVAGQLPVP